MPVCRVLFPNVFLTDLNFPTIKTMLEILS